jgi:hypothetical protein
MKTLMIGAASLVLTATPALSSDESVCRSVAAQIKALPAAPFDASSDLIEPPIQRLADDHGSGVALDASAPLTGDRAQALDAALKSRFGASAAVLSAVDALDAGDANSVWLRRLGASDLHAVEAMAGTMDCQNFVFFEAAPGKSARLVSAPPQRSAIGDSGSSFCTTAEGLAGRIGSTPVFIEQGWDSVAPVYDIDIAAWRGSAWAKPCSLHVVFRSTYRVAATNCHGDACAALPAASVAIAVAREAQIVARGAAQEAPPTFAWGPAVPAAGRAKVEQLKELIGVPPNLDVSIVTGDTQHGFADDAVTFPVMLGGQAYAAVLSHGGIGWRIYPDFVLSLYDLKDGAAERIASVHIVREVGPAQSLKVAN